MAVASKSRTRQLTTAVRVVARLSRVVDGVCQKGELSLAQYRLLLFLSTASQRSGELADRAALRPPTLTALVDGLEKHGLVQRVPVANDRRGLQVEITDAGQRALARTEAALVERLGGLFADCENPAAVLDGLAALESVLDERVARRLAEGRP